MMATLERNEDLLRMDPSAGLGELADKTGGFLIAEHQRSARRLHAHRVGHAELLHADVRAEERRVRRQVPRDQCQGEARRRERPFAQGLLRGPRDRAAHADLRGAGTGDARPHAGPQRVPGARLGPPVPRKRSSAEDLRGRGAVDRGDHLRADGGQEDLHVRLHRAGAIQRRSKQVIDKISQRYQVAGPIEKLDQAKNGQVVFYRQPDLPPGFYTMETVVYDALSQKASVRFTTVEQPTQDIAQLRMSSLVLVSRGENAEGEPDNGNPLIVHDTLLYPNLGQPLKKDADKELAFFFTAYPTAAQAQLTGTIELLQNATVLARVPLQLSAADQTGASSNCRGFPSARCSQANTSCASW